MNLGWPNMFQPSPLGWFMALGLLFIHNSPVVALFQWPETWELPGPRPKTGSSGPATAPAVPSSDPSLAIGCSGTTCENVDPFGDPKMWPFCPTRMIQFFGYSPITFRKWWWSMIDLNWKTSWQLILKKSQVSFSSQSQGLMEQNALNISWVRNWVSKDLDEKNCISNWFQNHGFLLPLPTSFRGQEVDLERPFRMSLRFPKMGLQLTTTIADARWDIVTSSCPVRKRNIHGQPVAKKGERISAMPFLLVSSHYSGLFIGLPILGYRNH